MNSVLILIELKNIFHISSITFRQLTDHQSKKNNHFSELKFLSSQNLINKKKIDLILFQFDNQFDGGFNFLKYMNFLLGFKKNRLINETTKVSI